MSTVMQGPQGVPQHTQFMQLFFLRYRVLQKRKKRLMSYKNVTEQVKASTLQCNLLNLLIKSEVTAGFCAALSHVSLLVHLSPSSWVV